MECRCKELIELNGMEAQNYYKEHLKKISVDGQAWQITYQCPITGILWLADFPHSERQGGGPPRLRKKDDAV